MTKAKGRTERQTYPLSDAVAEQKILKHKAVGFTVVAGTGLISE